MPCSQAAVRSVTIAVPGTTSETARGTHQQPSSAAASTYTLLRNVEQADRTIRRSTSRVMPRSTACWWVNGRSVGSEGCAERGRGRRTSQQDRSGCEPAERLSTEVWCRPVSSGDDTPRKRCISDGSAKGGSEVGVLWRAGRSRSGTRGARRRRRRGLHLAEEQHVVAGVEAPVLAGEATAHGPRDRALDQRRASAAQGADGRRRTSVATGGRELPRQVVLVGGQHVDGEPLGDVSKTASDGESCEAADSTRGGLRETEGERVRRYPEAPCRWGSVVVTTGDAGGVLPRARRRSRVSKRAPSARTADATNAADASGSNHHGLNRTRRPRSSRRRCARRARASTPATCAGPWGSTPPASPS